MENFNITNYINGDGFGSQFQTIICTILYAYRHDYTYLFNPIYKMEHNYANHPDFCNDMNEYMNLTHKYQLLKNTEEAHKCGSDIKYTIDHDIDGYVTNEALMHIKECFWQNKDRNVFGNSRLNVVVHVRRPNSHDNRVMGTNTPDEYYLNLIQKIRNEYRDRNPLFHIHSQGNLESFEVYRNTDTIIKLDTDLRVSFTEMVAADILIMSASSFSYIAGYLCEGIVYYMPFWHKPRKQWIHGC
jgi:hypothetical protein